MDIVRAPDNSCVGERSRTSEGSRGDRRSRAHARYRDRGRRGFARCEDNPTDNVISLVRGHVDLKNGIATLTEHSFAVPGADAAMHGTYNVPNEKIEFHGTMKMEAKFSQSTSGIKSLLAKVLDPFFNKKRGSIVPVVVNGTYHDPHFGIDLNPLNK